VSIRSAGETAAQKVGQSALIEKQHVTLHACTSFYMLHTHTHNLFHSWLSQREARNIYNR